MILEICCILPEDWRDKLLPIIHRRLVIGAFDDGAPGSAPPLNLMSWIPPDDWCTKIFDDNMPEGQGVFVPPFAQTEVPAGEILDGLRKLVSEMRQVQSQFQQGRDIPLSACVMAALLHRRPLPPELWRRWAFP